MSNITQDPSSGDKPAKSKELSMEQRLGIAFALMTLVLFVTPYFVKTTGPQPAPKKTQAPVSQTSERPPEPVKAAAEAPSAPGQVTSAVQDDSIVLDTDLYTVRFSNKGAVVRSWILKKYLDANRKPVELVNPAAAAVVGFPFALIFKGPQPEADPNQALFAINRTADGRGVDFEFSDGRLHVRKGFRLEQGRYLAQVSTEVRNQGVPLPHLMAWRGGFGDFSVANTLSTQHTLFFDKDASKLTVSEVSVAKSGTVTNAGNYQFAGIEDTYFTAVALPAAGVRFEVQTWSDRVPFAAEQNKEQPHIGVALGGDGANRASMFVGPKDIDILKAVDPRLEQAVDFGWFAFLAKPLFWSLNLMNDKYVHNYGWSIVLVTVIINVLLLPLKISNLKSMKKMSALQPQIQQIQAKYQNLAMRDPRRQEQQQEMMDLYKKHGVNPLGGCLPVMLQLPFFLAFYKVLTVAIEMRGAPWLWVSDLSQPEALAIRILPLATVATQFAMQKMTPTTTMDPQQQRIMQLMPLMFIFVFYSVSSGLVLYWLTSNVVGIAQQWFFNRLMPVQKPPAAAPVSKKSPKK